MHRNLKLQRAMVCLAGIVALVLVGGQISAADEAVKAADEADINKAPGSNTTRPGRDQKFVIAVAERGAVFNLFKGREQIQKQVMELRKQAGPAQRAGDQQKLGSLRMQMQEIEATMMKGMNDALETVAKREHYDAIVGEVLYKSDGVEIPDASAAVAEEMNATTTFPADDFAETKPAEEQSELNETPEK